MRTAANETPPTITHAHNPIAIGRAPIALISLCGTLSIFVLPFLGHVLGLSDQSFGAWAGAAVHDVGQVIATASVWSDEAVKSAIVIKLARVCLLAPIVLILSIRHRRYLVAQGEGAQSSEKIPLIPFLSLALSHLQHSIISLRFPPVCMMQ